MGISKLPVSLLSPVLICFSFEVTQCTNSQNSLTSADFYANEPIQERLQIESYKTDLWYEKRRGKFRVKVENATPIDKEILTGIYLICHLEEPVLANNNRQYHFISRKDDKNGLYKYIFKEETRFSDSWRLLGLFKVNIISTYSKPGIVFH